MKSKYGLLKVLLVLLAFVSAGIVYSCAEAGKESGEAVLSEGEQGISSKEEGEAAISRDAPGSDSQDAYSEGEGAEAGAQSGTADDGEAAVCVYVCGAVESAGVYYLPEGSRVHEAVTAAGGLREDAAAEYVNLADTVYDGEQIYIPTAEEADAGGMELPSAQGTSGDGLININTAGTEELMTLPGIGESKAEAIITYRENVAAFESIEDIMNVSGIKDSVFEKIKEYIKV